MKVIEDKLSDWTLEYECTGCNSKLAVGYDDFYKTRSVTEDYANTYIHFDCPLCRSRVTLDPSTVPRSSVISGQQLMCIVPTKKEKAAHTKCA